MLLAELGFAALLAASGATVAWFFPARGYMLRLMKAVALELEDALRPVDATYQWLGVYVGFHAVYRVRGLRVVRALLTLLPRHALLYLPFALLRGERDTLIVEAVPRGGILRPCCEARGKTPRSVSRQLRRLGVVECSTPCPERLSALLDRGALAVWMQGDAVGAAMEPRPGSIRGIVEGLVEYAKLV